MPRHWFIKTNSGTAGPVTSKKLVRLVTKGKIQPNTGISSDGETWVKAKKIVGLPFPDEDPKLWFVKTKAGIAGPFTVAKFRKLAKQGRIKPNVQVSADKQNWIKANQVPGVRFKRSAVEATDTTARSVSPEPADETEQQPTLAIASYPHDGDQVCFNFDGIELRTETTSETEFAPFDEKRSEVACQCGQLDFDFEAEPPYFTLASIPRDGDQICFRFEGIELRNPGTESVTEVKSEWSRVDENQLELDFDAPIVVTPPKPAADLRAIQREEAYLRHFGPFSEVRHDSPESDFPIDVYVHPPNQIRPFTTLVTSGMSNFQMPVPTHAAGMNSSRTELVLYVDQMSDAYVRLLQFLAASPQRQQTWLSYGAKMNNGNPARPIFRGSPLDSYLFMVPNIESDFMIHRTLQIDESPVQLLWVVPITTAERSAITTLGMRHFCWLLDQNQHGLTVDPRRHCYAKASQQAHTGTTLTANQPIASSRLR